MLVARQIITFLIIPTFLLGCSDNSATTNKMVDNPTTNDSISPVVSLDSTISNENDLPVNDSIIAQIKNQTSWDRDEYGRLELDTLVKLSDDDFYLLYSIHDGVSSTKYLMTFKRNKFKDLEVLEWGPDADLSYARYEYSKLRESKKNTFKKVHFIETPIDKSKVDENGWFKEGYSMDNVEINTDSTIILFSINSDCSVKRDTLMHSH
jgi:hypothetical protein